MPDSERFLLKDPILDILTPIVRKYLEKGFSGTPLTKDQVIELAVVLHIYAGELHNSPLGLVAIQQINFWAYGDRTAKPRSGDIKRTLRKVGQRISATAYTRHTGATPDYLGNQNQSKTKNPNFYHRKKRKKNPNIDRQRIW